MLFLYIQINYNGF